MSRTELQALVTGALVRISEDTKGHHDPIRDSANIIANRVGIHWSAKREFARNVERILRDCYERHEFSRDVICGEVADWILEAVTS